MRSISWPAVGQRTNSVSSQRGTAASSSKKPAQRRAPNAATSGLTIAPLPCICSARSKRRERTAAKKPGSAATSTGTSGSPW